MRRLLDAGFSVDGVDIKPAFVEIARAKCPEATFHVGWGVPKTGGGGETRRWSACGDLT